MWDEWKPTFYYLITDESTSDTLAKVSRGIEWKGVAVREMTGWHGKATLKGSRDDLDLTK